MLKLTGVLFAFLFATAPAYADRESALYAIATANAAKTDCATHATTAGVVKDTATQQYYADVNYLTANAGTLDPALVTQCQGYLSTQCFPEMTTGLDWFDLGVTDQSAADILLTRAKGYYDNKDYDMAEICAGAAFRGYAVSSAEYDLAAGYLAAAEMAAIRVAAWLGIYV